MLLQRLAEFVEETRVLDCDDSLMGEGLEQGDLCLGKGLDFDTAQADRTEGDALTQQRYRQRRAMTTILACGLATLWVLSVFGLQIGHLDSPRLEHRATIDRTANQREREFSNRTVCETVTGDQE